MLNRVRGLIVGHAIGSAVGSQTKMRLKTDGASVTFPSTVSYRGRPPCSWGSVTDVFLILLRNVAPGGVFDRESELGAAQDLSEWTAGTLDYIFTGPACASAYEKKVIGTDGFLARPREIAADLWSASAGRATFAEPCAYAPVDAFVSVEAGSTATGILYASDRCEFAANVIGYICRGICGGEYNSSEHIDELLHTIMQFSAAQKIKHADIFGSFSEEVSFWMKLGFEGNVAALRLDDINTINNPLKTLGCVGYVLKCIRYALEHERQPSFRRILIKFADECGNADVHCAVIGAILGGYIGYADLPPGWVEALHDITRLRSITEDVIPQILKRVDQTTESKLDAASERGEDPGDDVVSDSVSLDSITTESSTIQSDSSTMGPIAETNRCLAELSAVTPSGESKSSERGGDSTALVPGAANDAEPAAIASIFSAPDDS